MRGLWVVLMAAGLALAGMGQQMDWRHGRPGALVVTQEVDAVALDALWEHANTGTAHLTPAQIARLESALTNEVDYKALCLYHYGSVDIEPSPADWFGVVNGVIMNCHRAGRVVVPWEINGQPVRGWMAKAFMESNQDELEYLTLDAMTELILPRLDMEYVPWNDNSMRYEMVDNFTLTSLVVNCTSLRMYEAYNSRAIDMFQACRALKCVRAPYLDVLDMALYFATALELVETGASYESLSVPYTLTNLQVVVTNPQAKGWPNNIYGTPVVRPGLHTDKLILNGVEYTEIATGGGAVEWQGVTNTSAAVTIATTGSPIYWQGAGNPTLTLTGLVPGMPIYLVCQGMTSLQIADGYLVGGGEFQAGRANHYLVWRYGAEVLVTGITTTAEGTP